MKIIGSIAIAVLVLSSALAPLRSAAQTVSEGASPELHAWFEYEYARDATSLSVSEPHREAVVDIIQSFQNGQLNEADASKRINSVLSPDEKSAVLAIEQSFFVALNQILPAGDNALTSHASMSEKNVADPGQFLLLLLNDSSSPSPATI